MAEQTNYYYRVFDEMSTINTIQYTIQSSCGLRLHGPLFVFQTRNTFRGTLYLSHSYVHNEKVVPVMAKCMAHARNLHISSSALKSDVTVVSLDPDFF